MSTNHVSSIRKTSIQVAKKYRKSLTLIWLFSWAFNAGIQRYISETVDFNGVATALEQWINTNLSSLLNTLENWEQLWVDAIASIYGGARALIQPHLPVIWGLWILGAVVSILIYMIIAHLTLHYAHDPAWEESTQIIFWNILHKVVRQFFPYVVTVLLQSVVTLFFLGLFIIPGIIVWTYFMFTNIVALDQEKYFFAAMKESRSIVKHRWRNSTWVAFSIVFLAIIALIFLGSITTFVASWFSDIWTQMALSSMVTAVFSLFIQILLVVFYVRRKKTIISSPNKEV